MVEVPSCRDRLKVVARFNMRPMCAAETRSGCVGTNAQNKKKDERTQGVASRWAREGRMDLPLDERVRGDPVASELWVFAFGKNEVRRVQKQKQGCQAGSFGGDAGVVMTRLTPTTHQQVWIWFRCKDEFRLRVPVGQRELC